MKKPIFFDKMAAQGDFLITRISELPDGLEPVTAEKGLFTIAHSETGHHHVLNSAGVEAFYPANDNDEFKRDFTMYLAVENDSSVIEHMRSFDTHAPLGLKSGIYRINRQREYTPEGWRRAQD